MKVLYPSVTICIFWLQVSVIGGFQLCLFYFSVISSVLCLFERPYPMWMRMLVPMQACSTVTNHRTRIDVSLDKPHEVISQMMWRQDCDYVTWVGPAEGLHSTVPTFIYTLSSEPIQHKGKNTWAENKVNKGEWMVHMIIEQDKQSWKYFRS